MKISVSDYSSALPGIGRNDVRKQSNVSQGIENCSFIIHGETERYMMSSEPPYRDESFSENVSLDLLLSVITSIRYR